MGLVAAAKYREMNCTTVPELFERFYDKKGRVIAVIGLIIFPIGFLCALMGMAARVAYPGIKATMALPKIIMSLDPVLSGTTLAALWAADVSTACTLLLGAGTLFSQDVYKRFIHPKVEENQYMVVNRLAILAIGIITLWLAFNAVGILRTLLIGLSLTTAFTVVFLFTVFAPSLCRRNSAFYTTLVGILALAVWQMVPAVRVFAHPIYMEWLVCLATFFLVAVFDKERIPSVESAVIMN